MPTNSRKKAGVATRRSEALELYFKGVTMRQIAEQLQCSLGTVCADVNAELKAYSDQSRRTLRMQKLEEFAALKSAWRDKAIGGDHSAACLYLKILAQETKTFGVDAEPQKAYDLFYSEPDPMDDDDFSFP